MNKKEQLAHFDIMVGKMRETLEKKGQDYANDDVLSNFKLAGQICGLKPEQNCLSLIATKVARLGVLLNSDKSPNNESIQDSVLDLANYSLLLSMILAEVVAERPVADIFKEKKLTEPQLKVGDILVSKANRKSINGQSVLTKGNEYKVTSIYYGRFYIDSDINGKDLFFPFEELNNYFDIKK